MPWLLALAVAAGITVFALKRNAVAPGGSNTPLNALLPGHWYRVSMLVTASPATQAGVVAAAGAWGKAEGFTGPVAVLAVQNLDKTWSATVTGPYATGLGVLTSAMGCSVLEAQEVKPPAGVVVPQTPPNAQRTVASSGFLVTLQPGTMSATASLGAPVSVQLPVGASWLNQNGVVASGTSPITWTYAGPGVLAYDWKDASGASQHTVVNLTTGGL